MSLIFTYILYIFYRSTSSFFRWKSYTNTIIIIRTFLGPVLNSIALFRYYLTSTLLAIPLAIAESIIFRCLMIFFFNDTAMVNDEFLATFLNLFNTMIGQMISIVRLNIGEFLYHQGPDHVQVFWKHKSIGNQASDWLTR